MPCALSQSKRYCRADVSDVGQRRCAVEAAYEGGTEASTTQAIGLGSQDRCCLRSHRWLDSKRVVLRAGDRAEGTPIAREAAGLRAGIAHPHPSAAERR